MQINGRKWLGALVCVFAFTWIAWPALATEKEVVKGKVAIVNGAVIPQTDFDRELGRAKQMYSMGKKVDDSQLPEIKEKALEQLIERELLYQESRNKGIEVDEEAVTSKIDALRKRFPGEDQFKKGLEKMNLTEAILKSQFRQGMAIQELIETQVAQKVKVSEQEIKDYYDGHPQLFKQPEKIQAKHILINVDPKADESKKAEAKNKIKKAQQRLKAGEQFSKLAEELSQCPSSKKGGDLGYFGRGQMVKSFEEAAFTLKPGEVSDIVETRFGYHLIKLVDKKEAATVPYKEAKDRLIQQLKRQKTQKQVTQYVAKLKENAKIERFLGTSQ